MMKVLGVLLLAFAVATLTRGAPCGDGIIRGVNLGGLFVLEPWITPNIFQEVNAYLNDVVVDEYTYAQYVNRSFYEFRMDKHWDNFYTQQDLQELYDSGISHVRLPIGYWLVDVTADEPFPAPPATDDDGQRFYIKRLLSWCDQIGLKVLIDLHGAPGSQNGFDNSGRRGPVRWFQEGDSTNPDRTLIILDKVAELLQGWILGGTINQDTLYGIAIMNEPAAWDEAYWQFLRDVWHYSAYDVIRTRFPDPSVKFVVQQAFRNQDDWIGYMPEPTYQGVELDLHEYHAFGSYWNDLAADPTGWSVNLETACSFGDVISRMSLPTFLGEWSLAVCDCQQYLDGGYANPYIPPNASAETCDYYNGYFDTYPQPCRDFLRDFMLAQMDSAERGRGFFFWTAKTENNCGPEWDYLQMLREGIAPADLCNRNTYCS